MKLLVLGGSIFLGRAIVDAALAAGHEVTLFNRGIHNPDLYPGVEKIRGDRRVDLSPLEGRSWDAVIDTSGYVPRVVRQSASSLADRVDHYTFVSSLSVYADTSRPGLDETAPVATLAEESMEEVTGDSYGPLKALCERAAEAEMPGRTASVRAGLIVGPHDPSDRFTYWVHRVAKGGDILAPGRPEQPVSFIDVRDLGEWLLVLAGARTAGVFNATGPAEPCSMGAFLEECRLVTGADARFVWADQEFLASENVAPWQELPMWLPDEEEYAGFNAFDSSRARAAGLTFRPVSNTICATWEWDRRRDPPSAPGDRAGLSEARERELLKRLV
jgi:2'-hydroxyisoflavone reductase